MLQALLLPGGRSAGFCQVLPILAIIPRSQLLMLHGQRGLELGSSCCASLALIVEAAGMRGSRGKPLALSPLWLHITILQGCHATSCPKAMQACGSQHAHAPQLWMTSKFASKGRLGHSDRHGSRQAQHFHCTPSSEHSPQGGQVREALPNLDARQLHQTTDCRGTMEPCVLGTHLAQLRGALNPSAVLGQGAVQIGAGG